MSDRRSCLRLACFAPLLTLPELALGAPPSSGGDEAAIDQMIRSWRDEPEHKKYFVFEKPGTKGSLRLAPGDPRVRQAAQQLASVPKDIAPIAVAKHLITKIPEGERMEWPEDKPGALQPANPLIIAFFAATKTDPWKGDQTAWCAAFACWALQHAGVAHPNNAGSKSFRTWSTESKQPRKGDIAVFVNKADPTFGHVGFFDGYVDESKRSMFLVGGNQSNQLNRKKWEVESRTLKLHSFRTVADRAGRPA